MGKELIIRLIKLGEVSEEEISSLKEQLLFWGCKVVSGSGTESLDCDAIIVISEGSIALHPLTAVIGKNGEKVKDIDPENLVLGMLDILTQKLVEKYTSKKRGQ